MKLNKTLLVLPLVSLLTLTTGCGETGKFAEYYDKNWVPGENALTTQLPVLKNPKGEFGILSNMRRSMDKAGLPSKGEANILVVPINFLGDEELQKEVGSGVDISFTTQDLTMLSNTYFRTSENPRFPSVTSFYQQSSFGKLNLSGVVSPVVTMPKSYTDYLLKAYASSNVEAYNEIIDYVYDYLFNVTETYYIGDFDSDNDKRVDAISLVCNYPYGISLGDDTITALHQSFVGINNVYFSSDIKDINKTPVNSFSFVSDAFRTPSFLNSYDSHVFINLVGQMMGLSAYDDTTGNANTGYYRAPLAYKDIMDGFMGDHNSFSKYQLGWIEPTFIKAEDIDENGLEITIESAVTSGDSIILYTGEESMFGEYLVIDLYSPTGVNKYDSTSSSIYGYKLFDEEAVRVYQVDSRLVRGYNGNYAKYQGTSSFDETIVLPNGEEISYQYDYAYTNSSTNNYASYGLENYALVSLLTKDGSNRHMTYFGTELTIDDMFLEGDSFGSDDQLDGFYKDFAFHESGKLGIAFTIDKIEDGKATITFRRAQ